MKLNKKKYQNQPTTTKKSYVNEVDLGIDQDEQAMNGDYGMLETKKEDQHRKKPNQ
ncbi:DUF4021 domain-containing protein [Guptibacillus hwajinpoensis]|uniref:DUF4021 domain-containing protein n=1 Tax=Guptibacillus hwajinpoensis TaxID=208199 RepID=UPI001CD2451E|nr:DUF4021 domain-containing protein [Pseudalkalibacillus hwajinpoensis]MCA0993438.1 DUF4021 domain-containing protein [Pseudalkalibacillus hwajinpoensis]